VWSGWGGGQAYGGEPKNIVLRSVCVFVGSSFVINDVVNLPQPQTSLPTHDTSVKQPSKNVGISTLRAAPILFLGQFLAIWFGERVALH
jgi:hypothetical protein